MTDWPYAAPVDDGRAQHLQPGHTLAAVALPSASGGRVVIGGPATGRTIVVCYPWTGRPGAANPPDWDTIPGAHGSTPQLVGFRDGHAAFKDLGAVVIAVSTQASDDQRELATRLSLPFELASDLEGALHRTLALPVFETGGVTYLKRLTLILGDGAIERVFYPVHPPPTHAGEVLAWLAARDQ